MEVLKKQKKKVQLDFVATKEQFHHSACLQETLGNRSLSSKMIPPKSWPSNLE